MNILITSGGTSERIDQVRSITNHSTGRLGKIISEQFLEAGFSVTLVTTPTAVQPKAHPRLTKVIIKDVAELQTALEKETPTHQVLIHAMAVSDYSPVYMSGFQAVKEATNLEQFLQQTNQEPKISSEEDYQILFLKKNPKLISLVKTWNPDIRLVGFKLLVNVPQDQLLSVARASLEKNQAEMIVANDLRDIQDGKHRAYLVSDQDVQLAETKSDIAQKIYHHITNKG